MHGVSISSKLSNLLKSRSSSVSADRTRPLPRTGDLYTGPENVAPLDPLITRGHQTSRVFARRGKSISRETILKWMSSRAWHSRLMWLAASSSSFCLRCTQRARSSFYFLSPVNARDNLYAAVSRYVKSYLVIAIPIHVINFKHVECF